MSEESLERKPRHKKKLGSYPYLSVVLSISLALFVIGLFGLLILQAKKLTNIIQGNVEIQVYLNHYITESEQIKIQKTLESKPFILQDESVNPIEFISKDEAATLFIEETGEDFLEFLGENPLRDAFSIRIDPEYQDPQQLQGIKAEVENISGVFEVSYIESLISSINRNITKISIVLMGFAIILILIVIMLINNTIKLALFSQRFLIRSMQLVGATSGFIRKPFVMRATFHGIFAGIMACGALFALLQYAYAHVEGLSRLVSLEEILMLFVLILLLGAIIGSISTFRAINKYLRMSLDDLY